MHFQIGDLVTRNSYNNDVVFQIVDIDKNIVLLKGINIRLLADSEIEDLKKVNDVSIDDDELYSLFSVKLDRDEYFYLPGKILHVDGCNALCKSNKILIK